MGMCGLCNTLHHNHVPWYQPWKTKFTGLVLLESAHLWWAYSFQSTRFHKRKQSFVSCCTRYMSSRWINCTYFWFKFYCGMCVIESIKMSSSEVEHDASNVRRFGVGVCLAWVQFYRVVGVFIVLRCLLVFKYSTKYQIKKSTCLSRRCHCLHVYAKIICVCMCTCVCMSCHQWLYTAYYWYCRSPIPSMVHLFAVFVLSSPRAPILNLTPTASLYLFMSVFDRSLTI